MQDGFVKVSARTPEVRVADVNFNVEQCVRQVEDACADGAKVVVLPELCITGYTCEDLFWQDALLDAAPFVRVVGDAVRPSNITNAVYEGWHAAYDI